MELFSDECWSEANLGKDWSEMLPVASGKRVGSSAISVSKMELAFCFLDCNRVFMAKQGN